MEIRSLTRGDKDEWVRMRGELYGDPDIGEIDQWYKATTNGDPDQLVVAVLVADRGKGGLAGFVEIGSRNYAEGCDHVPVAYLEGWFVDADVRRSGLGRRLVTAAEEWAIAHGYRDMASDVELGNDVSLDAHRALGFEEVDRIVCLKKRLDDM